MPRAASPTANSSTPLLSLTLISARSIFLTPEKSSPSLFSFLAGRLRRPQLDTAGQSPRRKAVKVKHSLGDVLAGKLPAFPGLGAGRRGKVGINAARHDVADANAIVADVLHHGFTEAVQPEL